MSLEPSAARRRESSIPRWLIRAAGPLCFAALRIGQEYSTRRQLGRLNAVGAGTVAGPGLRVENHGTIRVGRNAIFGDGVSLTCYEGGTLEIGDDVFLANHCIVAADRGTVTIGSDSQFAEGVSIRAGNHGTDASMPIRLQENRVEDIRIGRDVWVAKGAIVVAGAQLADGCVVMANSVACGRTEPMGIYGGIPIRLVGRRTQAAAPASEAKPEAARG